MLAGSDNLSRPLVSPETGPQHKVTFTSPTQQTRGGRALLENAARLHAAFHLRSITR
ncbi:hypothetical protein SAMN05216558_1765 [Pseudomonas vancouverensis]|nr:hypothetical protein SAMN05216558_1765 [Pseudomonas vancouverensis]